MLNQCEIKELLDHGGYACRDIAVLYRANFQSRVIEEGFSRHKIPYHIENGLKRERGDKEWDWLPMTPDLRQALRGWW